MTATTRYLFVECDWYGKKDVDITYLEKLISADLKELTLKKLHQSV